MGFIIIKWLTRSHLDKRVGDRWFLGLQHFRNQLCILLGNCSLDSALNCSQEKRSYLKVSIAHASGAETCLPGGTKLLTPQVPIKLPRQTRGRS